MTKKTMRTLCALLLCAVLGVAMNAAAFLIDTPEMRENAAASVETYRLEGASPQLAGGYRAAQMDNFTSVLIIKTAAYTGPKTLTELALSGSRVDMPQEEGQDGWDAFCTYADGASLSSAGLTYSRYWHGYTLPIRLLLCRLTASGIQMLLYYIEIALAMFVFALAMKRCAPILPGLLTAYFFLMPAASGLCLQYAPVTLIALAGCLALLLADARIERFFGMPGFFALLGLVTNYYDLLTFPLVALGFPLSVRIALRLADENTTAAALFKEIFLCGVAFGAAYAGMWALKWTLSAFLLAGGQFYGVFEQLLLRTSTSTESDGVTHRRMDAVTRNLSIITAKPAYLLVILLAGAASLLLPLRRAADAMKSRRRPSLDLRAPLYLLLALVPIAWTLVFANHSIDHAYYTYRNMTVSFLSLYACLSHMLRPAPQAAEKAQKPIV